MVSSFVDSSYHSAVIASIKTQSFLLSFILKILVCGIVPGFCKSGHKYVISIFMHGLSASMINIGLIISIGRFGKNK